MSAVLQYQDLRFDDYFLGGTEPFALEVSEQDPDRQLTPLKPLVARRDDSLEGYISSVCQQLLGARVRQFQFPGGRGRDATQVLLDSGKRAIFTRREHPGLTQREVFLMRRLHRHGALVPEVLATDGQHFIQEQVGVLRLTNFLHVKKQADQRLLALKSAAQGLLRIYQAAERAELDGMGRRLAVDPHWIRQLVDRFAILGQTLREPAPTPNLPILLNLLSSTRCRLIKWDARPGNAMLADQGTYWIDWEDARFRNRLDDLAWLLGDELMPEMPDVEAQILEQFVPLFADGMREQEARQYFYTFGVLHICTRLLLILSEHQRKPWKSISECIKYDKVGLHPALAMVLCKRAGRWASQSEALFVMQPWFERLGLRFAQMR